MADLNDKIPNLYDEKNIISMTKRGKQILIIGSIVSLATFLVVVIFLLSVFFSAPDSNFYPIYKFQDYFTDFGKGFDNPELGWAVDFRDNNADPTKIEFEGYMDFDNTGYIPGSKIKNNGLTIWTRIPSKEEVDEVYFSQGKKFFINRNAAICLVVKNCYFDAFVDYNGNGVRDTLDEQFTDLNNNELWDEGEPFTDLNGNGTYDRDETKVSNHYEQVISPRYNDGLNTNYFEAIPLDKSCAGHNIYITFHTNNDYKVRIYNIDLGIAASIYSKYYRNALITFVFAIAFVAFAFILILFSVLIKGANAFKPPLLFAAISSIFYAIYLLTSSGLLQILTHVIFSWTMVCYFSLTVSAMFYCIYLNLVAINKAFKLASKILFVSDTVLLILMAIAIMIPNVISSTAIIPLMYSSLFLTITALFVNQVIQAKRKDIEVFFPIFTGILIISVVTSTIINQSFNSPYIVIPLSIVSIIALYINIILQYKREVIDSNQEAQQSTKEQEMKSKIMLAQIQPHFLYNSLNSIAILCDIDPRQARDLTVKFSKYLRNNINSLSEESAVKFTQELANIRNYLEIEKIRFPNKLKIVEDIKVSEFLVPILSIQPLVENAVKHGISKKPTPSVLYISTYDDEDNYYVQIKDNGVGFDVSILDEKKKNGSIGIENVKYRLKSISNGNVNIESAIGVGTTVLVTLPKKDNKRRY